MTASKRTNHENTPVRLARVSDAHTFARLLHEFNIEFGESTPDAATIAERACGFSEAPRRRWESRRAKVRPSPTS
jgi:hypothetical protein